MVDNDAVEVGNLLSLGENWYYDKFLDVTFTFDESGNPIDKHGNVLREIGRSGLDGDV